MSEIEPTRNACREAQISDRLAKELNGSREAPTKFGRVDVLSNGWIVEVKEFTDWKAGLGQILAYADEFPGRQKRLHLFGLSPHVIIPDFR